VSVYIELQRLLVAVEMDERLRQALMEIMRRLEEEISSLNDRIADLGG
jgi:hypothetical protein